MSEPAGRVSYRLVTPSRSAMRSATRSALAMMVSVGLTAVLDTKKLESTTYRLSSSCILQFRSSADVAGSVPNRTVPFWCATAEMPRRPPV